MPGKAKVIAIDGPAGSGKSTTARLVAKELGFTYLDTGALYRALTYLALKNALNLEDGDTLAALSRNTDFRINTDFDKTRIWVNGCEITEAIRTPEVTRSVSQVAEHRQVRAEMVNLQRRLASKGNFVVEGRDIGTVVFPHADLKVFLIASLEARTKRRLKELRGKKISVSYESLKDEIMNRDLMDSQRETAPLRKAKDAIVVNTTSLTIVEQVDQIIRAFQQRMNC